VGRLPLLPDARLAMLTDGWAESAGPDGKLFGRERIQILLQELRSQPLATTADSFFHAVTSWRGGPATDDLTLVLIEPHSSIIVAGTPQSACEPSPADAES
jgi:serine phosphatase RsbU (regulator of sigma subunit)